MSCNKHSGTEGILAFFAGAAIGAGVALILAPKPGREVREKLAEAGEEAMEKIKEGVKEAKFKVSKKTPEDAFRYEGGDCWV